MEPRLLLCKASDKKPRSYGAAEFPTKVLNIGYVTFKHLLMLSSKRYTGMLLSCFKRSPVKLLPHLIRIRYHSSYGKAIHTYYSTGKSCNIKYPCSLFISYGIGDCICKDEPALCICITDFYRSTTVGCKHITVHIAVRGNLVLSCWHNGCYIHLSLQLCKDGYRSHNCSGTSIVSPYTRHKL